MGSPHIADRRYGLTPIQWGLLFVAFMVGLGSSFAIREVLPPVHADVTQAAPSNPNTAR
jgi:hypothetical protein